MGLGHEPNNSLPLASGRGAQRSTARCGTSSSTLAAASAAAAASPPATATTFPYSAPSQVSSDADLRKCAGYALLLLGCGAATKYSFPFPADAMHRASRSGTRRRRSTCTVYPTGGLERHHEVHACVLLQSDLEGALKGHGLRLQNFASIREQQVGGLIQVGAHGTGAILPPADEQVISMKRVSPAKGTIELSREKDPDLFCLACCGLGGLGVIAEVTLQSVERQRPQLVEHIFISNADEEVAL
ncbi:unnamed protein product [Miscanthus lutarioriparius]|uniref:L-galactono-1,4-lactone dehydrogenase n=1 Tax=Miscanthus lutarioriparius TaxID=422564 RepID=A0A811QL91_9POAL|nr:unnamed protein product [Miscanthus lutarioriparius]